MNNESPDSVENVVYVLGAGFSAALGLPVMANFLEKAKDLYFSDPVRYSHFDKVFSQINEMSVSKNYYDSDLFNIEEILSILEMQRKLARRKTARIFTDFITDVITAYTPKIPEMPTRPGNWQDFIFSREKIHNRYGIFVSALLHISLSRALADQGSLSKPIVTAERNPPYRYEYSVITLNYDVVLESYVDFSREWIRPINEFGFQTKFDGDDDLTPLAKLHGSVGDKSVVPPTWNKNLNPTITRTWQKALNLLQKANHIRVIGYSLPENDAYIRYLFKAAIVETQHLKTFDVICRDRAGQVRRKYDQFVLFPNYRFSGGDVEDYLDDLYDAVLSDFRRHRNPELPIIPRAFLQEIHDQFFDA